MKNLYILIFAFSLTTYSNAQWVTIPDAGFVNILTNNFPTCMNGNQMDTTCPGIVSATQLYFGGGNLVSDLTGLEYFDSLQDLDISYNLITTINYLPPGLLALNCNNNPLIQLPNLPSSLNILHTRNCGLNSLPPLPSTLMELYCDENNLTSLPALPPSLVLLNCTDNQITQLPTLPINLTMLFCAENFLTSLPVIPSSLYLLVASDNSINTLPALPNTLEALNINYNQINVLPLTFPDSLKTLNCIGNSISFLPTLPSGLEYLMCGNNQITNLPSLPPALLSLSCPDNLISGLPQLPYGLESLDVSNNPLSNLPNLPETIIWQIHCSNTLISSLPELPDQFQNLSISNCPNLHCLPLLTDIDNVQYIGTTIQCRPNIGNVTNSSPDLSLLPICNIFNPDGCPTYGAITGTVYEDINSNCIKDPGENGIGNIKVSLYQNGNLEQQVFTDGLGAYMFYTDTGTYTYTIDTLSYSANLSCPISGFHTSVLTAIDSTDYNMDFGIECPAGFDVGAWNILLLSGAFNPNFTALVSVNAGYIYSQLGLSCSQGIAGSVTVIISGPAAYLSPGPGALVPMVSGDTLIYQINNFDNVNPPTDFVFNLSTDTTAQFGDEICFEVIVLPFNGDLNISNNTLSHCFPAMISYDPNDKTVYPGGAVHPDNDWLYYTIRFQNTGNFPATNIQIRDTLDSNLLIESFQVTSFSHPLITQVNGNEVIFNFPNINLPDSVNNEPDSHGYVSFKIMQDPSLPNGTTIQNTAAIYFDFNSPVITNTVSTLIDNTVNIPQNIEFPGVVVFPNPVTSMLNIHFSANERGKFEITLSDLDQKLILKETEYSLAGENQYELSTGNLAKGVYVLQIKSESKVYRRRIVKL